MAEIQIALEIQKKRVTDKTEVQELLMMLFFFLNFKKKNNNNKLERKQFTSKNKINILF